MCMVQVIYPLSVPDAARMEQGTTPEQRWAALDRRLDGLMEAVRLAYLVKREGGWSAQASWGDTLSLGENMGLVSLVLQRKKRYTAAQ